MLKTSSRFISLRELPRTCSCEAIFYTGRLAACLCPERCGDIALSFQLAIFNMKQLTLKRCDLMVCQGHEHIERELEQSIVRVLAAFGKRFL